MGDVRCLLPSERKPQTSRSRSSFLKTRLGILGERDQQLVLLTRRLALPKPLCAVRGTTPLDVPDNITRARARRGFVSKV